VSARGPYATRAVRAGIYGIAPTPTRYETCWLRPRTPIPGLFLTGCDVGAMGVVGAIAGGAITAAAIEPWKAVRFLRALGWPSLGPVSSRAPLAAIMGPARVKIDANP
jgi:hypothetical protein